MDFPTAPEGLRAPRCVAADLRHRRMRSGGDAAASLGPLVSAQGAAAAMASDSKYGRLFSGSPPLSVRDTDAVCSLLGGFGAQRATG